MAIATRNWTAAILIAAAIYAGLLGGVSFLATPVKFLAPSLQLPVALDVGRHTFAALNKAEWVAALVLMSCCLAARTGFGTIGAAAILAGLIADTFWLLPSLDARVEMIIRGQWPAPSKLHHLYIIIDVAKLTLLLAITAAATRRLTRDA